MHWPTSIPLRLERGPGQTGELPSWISANRTDSGNIVVGLPRIRTKPISRHRLRTEPHASNDVYNKSVARHLLEDRVYLASEAGDVPSLPDTVQVLDAASGAVTETEVTWQLLEAQDAEQRVTATGTTELGAVQAIVDVVTNTTAPSASA